MQNTFITLTLAALLGACAPHVGDAADDDGDDTGTPDAGSTTGDDPDAATITEAECFATDLGDLGAVSEGGAAFFDNVTLVSLFPGDDVLVNVEFWKEETEDFATKYPPGTYEIAAGSYAECDVCVLVASLTSPMAYLAQSGTVVITSIDPAGRAVGTVSGLSFAQFDLVDSGGFLDKDTNLTADGCQTQVSAASFDVASGGEAP